LGGGTVTLEDLHKVEPSEEAQRQIREQKLKERRQTFQQIHSGGKTLYFSGHNTLDCFEDLIEKQYTMPSPADIIRLAGWLEANKGKS
jgi:uncharacterized Ntn-hydrolase superfamily protein